MAKGTYYYRLCEAEKLKQTYSSWIDKDAHFGAGQIEVLKQIIIKPKRSSKVKSVENLFTVKFEFKNAETLDAFEFLSNNGLTITDVTPKPRDPLAKLSGDANM